MPDQHDIHGKPIEDAGSDNTFDTAFEYNIVVMKERLHLMLFSGFQHPQQKIHDIEERVTLLEAPPYWRRRTRAGRFNSRQSRRVRHRAHHTAIYSSNHSFLLIILIWPCSSSSNLRYMSGSPLRSISIPLLLMHTIIKVGVREYPSPVLLRYVSTTQMDSVREPPRCATP